MIGDELRWDSPRLVELQARYASCDSPAMCHTEWSDDYVRAEIDLRRFRADNAYLWQHRDGAVQEAYELTFTHLAGRDRRRLLEILGEDGQFGAETAIVGSGRVVSRDLLDSVAELDFLDETIGIFDRPQPRVLDVGAGYGRFAHRLVTAVPAAEARCVDAVAVSTFLSEVYLDYRGVGERARVVPFDEMTGLSGWRPDIAVNIHSFSECSLVAIEAWVLLLANLGVRHLFVVPNAGNHGGTRLLSRECHGGRLDFTPVLHAAGFRLARSRPKYGLPMVQDHGVSPTHYYLFERV